MEFSVKFSAREFSIAAVAFIASVTVTVAGWVILRSPDITPENARHGWAAAALASEETQQIVADMPPFQVTGAGGEVISQDNTRARVCLWDAVLQVRGSHFPSSTQQVGDCVAWAVKHGVEYLACVEMAIGSTEENPDVYPPYIYGVSRVFIGKGQLRGDGSCVAWAVKGLTEYGVLRSDEDGVPLYSGGVSRQWGKSGPPRIFVDKARETRVHSLSAVRTADAVRDAVCNGYPVPFGAGGIGWDRTIEKYGRLVGVRSGSWNHAQCVIGYDGSGSEPLFCVLNSWGPLVGGKLPIDGSPPGSYWITRADMDYVARQGDAFAISDFDGFKARRIDFRLTQKSREKRSRYAFALAF